MFVTTDLMINVDDELAALLADYDAFTAAEDTLLTVDPGLDVGVVADPAPLDPPLIDPAGAAGGADAPVDPPAPDATTTAPPATDPVDPAPVVVGSDPADSLIDPGVDAPPFDFFLAPDELAFDLNEAALVGRRIGGEFFDFA